MKGPNNPVSMGATAPGFHSGRVSLQIISGRDQLMTAPVSTRAIPAGNPSSMSISKYLPPPSQPSSII